MMSRESLAEISCGRSCDGGVTSHSMSPVPAWICCWTLSCVRPSVTVIESTYAWRSVSVFWLHAGFRTSWNSFVGTYFVILYGPSESVCCRIGALSGTYFWYSTGRADEKLIARMFSQSGAGETRRKTTVSVDGAETPGTGCLLT